MSAKYKKICLLLFILQGMFCMNSCNNDDEDLFKPNIGTGDIVGSWYADKSDKESVYRKEYSFNPDGTYSFTAINMPSILDLTQTQESGTGIYNINGNVLRRGQDYKGGQGWLDPVEYKVEGNTLTTLNPYDYSVDTYYRIVDTYVMNVGEERKFVYEGESGQPTFETSSWIIASINNYFSDEHLDSISKAGIILANKFGEAYVTARYPSGNTVVIKIIVKDGDSQASDFFSQVMKRKDRILGLFGKNYYIGGKYGLEDQYVYLVGDKQMKYVSFMFDKEDKVRTVGAIYWSSCDMQKIKESWDKRFKYLGIIEGQLRYHHERDGMKMFCALDTLHHFAFWGVARTGFYSCNDYIYYDSVDNMWDAHCKSWIVNENEVHQAYGRVETTLPKNEVFQSLRVDYDNDTREISKIYLQCYPGYSKEYIDNWLKNNYYAFRYEGKIVYCNRKDYWNMMPRVIMYSVQFTNGNFGLAYEKH